MEEILLTLGLNTLNAVLSDPKYASLKTKLKPQIDEVTDSLVAAGFGTGKQGS